MPRTVRLLLPHTPHHIVQRGHDRASVFAGTADYRFYLASLKGVEGSAGCKGVRVLSHDQSRPPHRRAFGLSRGNWQANETARWSTDPVRQRIGATHGNSLGGALQGRAQSSPDDIFPRARGMWNSTRYARDSRRSRRTIRGQATGKKCYLTSPRG